MKISRLTTYFMPPRWLFLRIDTDEGVTGWGEPIVEGKAEVVAAAIGNFANYLLGCDPLRIEEHWQRLYRAGFYRGGPVLMSALAGVDQALWDIAGRVHGVPIHSLLGGHVRDRVRVYQWILGRSPAELADSARLGLENGYTAFKMNVTDQARLIEGSALVADAVSRMEAVRSVIGGMDLAVDFHGRLSPGTARLVLSALAPLHPLFGEEPVSPELNHTLPSLIASTSIPIATGERLYSRWDFLPVLQAGVSVVQPDLSHAGGISEVRRIASLAECFGAAVAPHCPLGPLALASSLQLGFATPNFLIQEQSLDLHLGADSPLLDYLIDPGVLQVRDGYLDRPTGPGLGIEVDAKAVEAAATEHPSYVVPTWQRDDGALAEW